MTEWRLESGASQVLPENFSNTKIGRFLLFGVYFSDFGSPFHSDIEVFRPNVKSNSVFLMSPGIHFDVNLEKSIIFSRP